MVNTPKYQKVIRDITEKIRNGILRPGEQIEQVSSLCETYDLSHVTVLRALREMAETGVLLRRPALGYFVAEPQAASQPVSIGCLVRNLWPSRLDTYTNEILCGIQQEFARRRINLIQIPQLGDALLRSDLPPMEEMLQLIRQINPHVDGFIFDPRFDDDCVKLILQQFGKPGVMILRATALPIHSVVPEIKNSAASLLRLLRKMDFRNFLFLEAGYGEAANIELAAVWEAERKTFSADCRSTIIRDSLLLPPEQLRKEFEYEAGKLLARGKTAVICCSDSYARDACNILTAKGVRIPEEAAVTGFYGMAESTLFKPFLATLKVNTFAIGTTAAGLLADQIAGVIKNSPQIHAITTEFIPGETI